MRRSFRGSRRSAESRWFPRALRSRAPFGRGIGSNRSDPMILAFFFPLRRRYIVVIGLCLASGLLADCSLWKEHRSAQKGPKSCYATHLCQMYLQGSALQFLLRKRSSDRNKYSHWTLLATAIAFLICLPGQTR
jgi:hypothetical protein